MQLDTIIHTLLTAASFLKKPLQNAAVDTVRELFDAICHRLRAKFGEHSDGRKVLELALEKPESAMRKAVLAEEARAAAVDTDPDLADLANRLAILLPTESESVEQNVQVNGQRNKVVVAGRDVVTAERVVSRTVVTPNDRHVTADEKKQIRGLVGELAARLGADKGQPNFAAAHRMLQRKLGVESYALIPRERFAEAVRFLKQRCAVLRLRSVRAAERMTQGAQ